MTEKTNLSKYLIKKIQNALQFVGKASLKQRHSNSQR